MLQDSSTNSRHSMPTNRRLLLVPKWGYLEDYLWLLMLPLGYNGVMGDYLLCLEIWGIVIIRFKLKDRGYLHLYWFSFYLLLLDYICFSNLNFTGMPKTPSNSQCKTLKVVISHTFILSYNSTYTCPQVLTNEPFIKLTSRTELCFISNPQL